MRPTETYHLKSHFRFLVLPAIITLFSHESMAATATTTNFVVNARRHDVARAVADRAEHFRREKRSTGWDKSFPRGRTRAKYK